MIDPVLDQTRGGRARLEASERGGRVAPARAGFEKSCSTLNTASESPWRALRLASTMSALIPEADIRCILALRDNQQNNATDYDGYRSYQLWANVLVLEKYEAQ